jgi:hypothetical protein
MAQDVGNFLVEEELSKRFARAIIDLNNAIVDTMDHLKNIEDNDIYGYIGTFRILYDIDSQLERVSKVMGEVKRQLSYDIIPTVMERLKTDSIKFDGRNFIRSVRVDASIPEHMHDKGFAWLREAGLEKIIKNTAHPKTLSSVLTHYMEETGITPPEDAIKIHTQPYIQVRK